MAQRHVDIDATTALPISDSANAETLTNTVRVVYDNTTNMNLVVDALQRAKEAIIRILGPLNTGS